MEKTPRYTQRERNMVLGFAAQYKDVIENKRTDAESNRKKDEVWLQIAKEFNSRVYHQRSAKQLRQLYKNMKLLLKKDLCGEDKGNRSFMDLLNTLSQQDSVQQYIAEQMSPDGAGASSHGYGGLSGVNGRQLNVKDDYDDTKMHLYEGMDTDVILIKSETISDNEHTEMDDDDDDDCLSPKAPEVCLEEDDDEVLFPTDLRQLQQQSSNGGGAGSGGAAAGSPTVATNVGESTAATRLHAASSPVCSTKTSVSSTGSYQSTGAVKPEISIHNVGNIRVGAFANINKTLQNGVSSNSVATNNNNALESSASLAATTASQSAHSPSGNSNGETSNGNGLLGQRALPLTSEQVQQHLLLNGLGLSAVHPPQHALQEAINAATSGASSMRRTQGALHLPRLQRGHNNSSAASMTTDLQLLVNGHHQDRERTRDRERDTATLKARISHNNNQHNSSSSVGGGGAGNFNGYNGNASGGTSSNNNGSGSYSAGGQRVRHNEYMMTLDIEERKRKIELLNAQIEYWQTLTKKLDTQSGHMPSPSCLCHFPASNGAGGLASVVAASSHLQKQASSS